MSVAESHAIQSENFCVKTAAQSFVSELLEEARLFTVLVVQLDLPWKELLKMMNTDEEKVQNVGNDNEFPPVMQVDETAPLDNETIGPTSQEEEEREEVFPDIVEGICKLNKVESNVEEKKIVTVEVTGSKEDEMNENFLNSTDLENSSFNLNSKDSGKNASDFGLLERTFLTLNRDEEQASDVESAEMIAPGNMTLHEVELLTESASDDEATSKNNEESSILKHENVFRRFCMHGRRMIVCLRNFAKKLTPSAKSLKKESAVISEEYLSEERKVKKYTLEVEVPTPEGTWKTAECGDGKMCLETDV